MTRGCCGGFGNLIAGVVRCAVGDKAEHMHDLVQARELEITGRVHGIGKGIRVARCAACRNGVEVDRTDDTRQSGWTGGATAGAGLFIPAVVVDRIDLVGCIETLQDQLCFQMVADIGRVGIEFGIGAIQADKRHIERAIRTVQPQTPA